MLPLSRNQTHPYILQRTLRVVCNSQGRPANCEFIGYIKSPQPMSVEGCVANHDELMSNFFAQPVRKARDSGWRSEIRLYMRDSLSMILSIGRS